MKTDDLDQTQVGVLAELFKDSEFSSIALAFINSAPGDENAKVRAGKLEGVRWVFEHIEFLVKQTPSSVNEKRKPSTGKTRPKSEAPAPQRQGGGTGDPDLDGEE